MIVYLITNKVNGKQYVGITSLPVGARWKKHIKNATQENRKTALYSAIRKYGAENFCIEKIEEVDEDVAGLRETYHIQAKETFRGKGYNMTLGGEGGCAGYHHSQEIKNFLSNLWRGRRHLEETKAKLSEARKGSKNPNFGRKMKPSSCLKISEKTKGANNPRAKEFLVTGPDGTTYRVFDRKGFCDLHKLNYFSVCSSIKRGRPYRGYTFTEVKE